MMKQRHLVMAASLCAVLGGVRYLSRVGCRDKYKEVDVNVDNSFFYEVSDDPNRHRAGSGFKIVSESSQISLVGTENENLVVYVY